MWRVFILTLLATVGAAAQGNGGPPQERKERYPAFRDAEVRLIEDYYRPGSGKAPPGLAKRGGDLPPGLTQQLRRGGTLPPGLESKVEPFPADLEKRIGPAPAGYRRLLFGKAALLVQNTTKLIVDIISVSF
ncbi:MAG: hypothetical protein HY858_06985 [Candidatus Solibacter usitatus]|nr:hypothetical protein [Candidatus Solibacter usitatus]